MSRSQAPLGITAPGTGQLRLPVAFGSIIRHGTRRGLDAHAFPGRAGKLESDALQRRPSTANVRQVLASMPGTVIAVTAAECKFCVCTLWADVPLAALELRLERGAYECGIPLTSAETEATSIRGGRSCRRFIRRPEHAQTRAKSPTGRCRDSRLPGGAGLSRDMMDCHFERLQTYKRPHGL